ncbi:MAG: M20/M25/M40 family metallo-hydrolase, partial [Myxococcota bacterium]|nr:M20/M25/M40 family metallo-hydrolase [Myxococcota bacterium]
MQSDPTELLFEMVKLQSFSGNEGQLAAFLCERMERIGIASRLDEVGNVIGVAGDNDPNANELILLGHMDTVQGSIPVKMEDGRLYGRGSVDAKGSLAAFISAVSQLTIPRGYRLVIVGAVEEETASSRGARYVAQHYQPSACIIGEPSGWNAITLGYKGHLRICYKIETSVFHSSA